jgi:CheY-like chemotaxis protein
MLRTIFDMFVQQPQTLDRSKGGLGLGLTIVRSIVEMHSGTVSVDSDGVGRGSEFLVELPAAGEGADTSAAAPRAGTVPAATRPRRILVVDDNEDAADMLQHALREVGHVVEVAHDGPTALARATRFDPEVAILDIGLPVLDGYELAQRLRALPARTGRLQLIAITGYGQDADRRRAAEVGFDRHMVKPVDLDALREAIRTH